jgi:hypothetical protein
MQLKVAAAGTEDFEELARRRLKLDESFGLVNEGKAHDVGKEAGGGIQVASSDASPGESKHTHRNVPFERLLD